MIQAVKDLQLFNFDDIRQKKTCAIKSRAYSHLITQQKGNDTTFKYLSHYLHHYPFIIDIVTFYITLRILRSSTNMKIYIAVKQ